MNFCTGYVLKIELCPNFNLDLRTNFGLKSYGQISKIRIRFEFGEYDDSSQLQVCYFCVFLAFSEKIQVNILVAYSFLIRFDF